MGWRASTCIVACLYYRLRWLLSLFMLVLFAISDFCGHGAIK